MAEEQVSVSEYAKIGGRDIDTIREESIRVLLIDPHTLTRAGFRYIVESQPDIKVVAQAGNINEALTLIDATKPDIILFEYKPEAGLSFEAPNAFKKSWKKVRVILVTGEKDVNFYVKAVKSGVVGIILKTQPPETLIKAIRKVHQGEVWIERSWIAHIVSSSIFENTAVEPDPRTEIINKMTEREMDLIPLIGRGLKNKQIAEQLCIAETTVRHHLTSIYGKLEVADRFELLILAQRYQLT